MPTERQIVEWNAAIAEIVGRDGISEEQAGLNLVAVITDYEDRVVEAVSAEKGVSPDEARGSLDRWYAAVNELAERENISHGKAGEDFAALLRNMEV